MAGIGFGEMLGSAIGEGGNAYLRGQLDREQELRKREVEDRDWNLRREIADENLLGVDATRAGKLAGASAPTLFQDKSLKPLIEDPEPPSPAAPAAVPGAKMPEAKKALALSEGDTEAADYGGGVVVSSGKRGGSVYGRPGTPLPKVEQDKGGAPRGGAAKGGSNPYTPPTQQGRIGGMDDEETLMEQHRGANAQGRALVDEFQGKLAALAQQYGVGSRQYNAYGAALADAYTPRIEAAQQQAARAFHDAAQTRSVNYAGKALNLALAGKYDQAKPYWEALGVDHSFMVGAKAVKDSDGKTISLKLENGMVLNPSAFSVLMNPAASMQDRYKALIDMESNYRKEWEDRQRVAQGWHDKQDPIIRRLDNQEAHDIQMLTRQGMSPEDAKKQAAIYRADNYRKMTGIAAAESKERTSIAGVYKAGSAPTPWERTHDRYYALNIKAGMDPEAATAAASRMADKMHGQQDQEDGGEEDPQKVAQMTPPATSAAPPAKANTPTYTEGQTATNPKTGARVVFRGGKWVPLKG